uniref:Oxidoreductase, short-chain dehydrogenase/reductase family protein n=1 Tax=uncultured Planctomycetota bacterium TaxID=120965 RepID=H5SDF3_9BACT|nr:oxidoreductase, short-chain dehydrogenase/reductase family protein [uncultured Planctomycetota bacterium]
MGRKRQLAGMRMLITGASQGIGRALARAACQRGAWVLATARSGDLLQQLRQEAQGFPGRLETQVADVTLSQDRHCMLDAAVEQFGGLDILINNAGIGATGHFSDASEERLRRIFEVNFFGPAELIRSAIPWLRQGRTPLIVNISSVVGLRAVPARSEYSASKFALQGLSEALRAELVRHGIDVLVVSPGLTATNFPNNMIENKARWPMDHKRSMLPEQVAEATLQAIEKGRNNLVLTWEGKMLVWLNRLVPWFVDWLMARKVYQLYCDEIESRHHPQPPVSQSEPATTAKSS